MACHPERSEGPWFLLAAATRMASQAETKVPRFARDDTDTETKNGEPEVGRCKEARISNPRFPNRMTLTQEAIMLLTSSNQT